MFRSSARRLARWRNGHRQFLSSPAPQTKETFWGLFFCGLDGVGSKRSGGEVESVPLLGSSPRSLAERPLAVPFFSSSTNERDLLGSLFLWAGWSRKQEKRGRSRECSAPRLFASLAGGTATGSSFLLQLHKEAARWFFPAELDSVEWLPADWQMISEFVSVNELL